MASELSSMFYPSRINMKSKPPNDMKSISNRDKSGKVRRSRRLMDDENLSEDNVQPGQTRRSRRLRVNENVPKRGYEECKDGPLQEVNSSRMKRKRELDEDEDQENDGISDYEKMVQNNIAERLKFLEELNINEAKSELLEVLPTKKPKSSKIQSYKETDRKFYLENPRRSSRLKELKESPGENGTLSMKTNFEIIDKIEKDGDLDRQRIPDPGPSNLQNYKPPNQGNVDASETFIVKMRSQKTDSYKDDFWPSDSKSLKEIMKSMRSSEETFAKVLPGRIFSIRVHPAVDKALVFVGGKYGDLGIWDADQKDDNIFYYGIHSAPINCMSIDNYDSKNLHTNSYDGSFRRLDLNTSEVVELYRCEERSYISWHSQKDPFCFAISGSRGFVDYVDIREKTDVSQRFKLDHHGSVKLVTIHPVETNYMATGSGNGSLSLWDLRKMNGKPVSELRVGRSPSGLEFSSVTGKYLLSTSRDDHLRVIKCDGSLKEEKKIKHNSQTGRWLTTFRSTWLPRSENHFVVGSMSHPRRIEIWNTDGNLVHTFSSEQLNSVMSVNSFHPSRRILAGGNASGKVILFRGED